MIGDLQQHIWNHKNHMGGTPMHINKNIVSPTGLYVIPIDLTHCQNEQLPQIEVRTVTQEDIQFDILDPIEKKYIQKKEKSKSNHSNSKKAKKTKSSKSSKSSKKAKGSKKEKGSKKKQ
jgi:hypothetical protein